MTRVRFLAWGAWMVLAAMASQAASARTVELVVNGEIKAPARHGLQTLKVLLETRGFEIERCKGLSGKPRTAFVVGQPGGSLAVDELPPVSKLGMGEEPESFLIKKLDRPAQPVILIAGSDGRGLMYALLEVSRSIELAPEGVDPLAEIHEVSGSPHLEVRGTTIHLFNADLDGQWYYREDFWRRYFMMLARSRLNTFALTFADHTSYLNPPYPFLVKVPEYPEVKAIGLTDAQREQNLQMLQRIAELASEHGIDFVFSTWMQGARLLGNLGPDMIEGLPEYPRDYAARALALILKSCPHIRGVQFRMNLESGIPEDKQADYYTALFEAIRDCGRPVRLDLRFKGLRPETIQEALTAGLDVDVSTKYWCEQMGQPYHPTVADKNYRHSRYGYGAMLHWPRQYNVTYRLWSVGTQKILLWGDPDFGSRFAQSCRLGGGRGFEVFAPLTNKGFGNAPGTWRIFADKTYEHYDYEQQRYWMFYLVFGRTGYNPKVPAYVWQREFRHRFGQAAAAVEHAYFMAGKILPLITATRNHSASEWRTWPEMEPGYILPAYARAVPGDTAQFYAIRSHRRVAGWRAEGWQSDIPGYSSQRPGITMSARPSPFRSPIPRGAIPP